MSRVSFSINSRYWFVRISNKRLDGLLKHYKEHGLTPKEKKSGGTRSVTAIGLDDARRVKMFLENYSQLNGLSLPGRVPGFARSDFQLLPSVDTKVRVYNCYRIALEADNSG